MKYKSIIIRKSVTIFPDKISDKPKLLLYVDDFYLVEYLLYLSFDKYWKDHLDDIYIIKRSIYTVARIRSNFDKNTYDQLHICMMKWFQNTSNDMPKFDYIILNPPYDGELHLKFFKACLKMSKEDGKIVIIEPSTWLIQLKENGKYTKENSIANEIKHIIEGHVSNIILENYNIQFRTDQYMPFSITFVDKSKHYDSFDVVVCGEHRVVHTLYDANLIGSYELVKSIFNKLKDYDKVKNHLYLPNKTQKVKGAFYCKIAIIISGSGSQLCAIFDPKRSSDTSEILQDKANKTDFSETKYDIMFENQTVGNHLQNYTSVLYHRYENKIQKTPLKKYDRGKNETNKDAECITGTKTELENWKYFVLNNSLPLFINICLTIDQHNNSLDYVPWLVDKKYTDEEIYNKFGFTDEEIKLIETTIKKYERTSPWFKRYMCGPFSVSDEEVQKFIDEINA